EMREHLGKTLPEYMRPQVYVRLEAFPLTPNNKVDRKRLPAPSGEQAAPRNYVEPRNDLERQVAGIFGEVLGMAKVSVDDNFFHLGGHSLLAAHVVSRLARDLKVAVPMRRIFESPTVAKLAASIDANKAAATPVTAISRGERQDLAPLTAMQQRVWFAEQMDPGTAVFNLPSAFRIKGKFDIAGMQKALQMLVDRHSTLRTTLEWVDGAPMQRIAPSLTLEVPVSDLTSLPQAEREPKVLAQVQHIADTPIDISKLPLVVAHIFKLAAEEHVLYWMPHHAIWDGWSFDVFLEELDKAYTSAVKNEPPTWKQLPVTYADFARWQSERMSGPEIGRQSQFWKKLLTPPLPSLELATDKPRPAQFDFKGHTDPFTMSKDEIEKLTAMARQYDATLYMALLAGFAVLLYRMSEGEDVIIGTPVRGRGIPEIDGLLGFFVNTLALRLDLKGEPTFGEVLTRTRNVVLDAFSNQDMPFEVLVKELNLPRDPSRTPVYQSFFTFQDVRNRGASFGGAPYSQIHVHAEVTPTDLSFWVKQWDDGIVGGIDYATNLFERDTMLRFLEELRTLLSGAAANPSMPIGRLPILPAAERETLARWNATPADYPKVEAHRMVFAQAEKTPDAVAIVQGATQITYKDLVTRVKALAGVLAQNGVTDGTFVGIHLNRSVEMVVATLAVQEAGGAYVPLDPAFPAERVQFMVADSKAPVIITETALQETFAKAAVKQVLVDKLESAPPLERPARNEPESLAYVLYTS
ncbi:MAG TPA: condensation domain-containing protein, partial [Myxococcota bacterium]|nr:condensation domain-containing protein [Myxococcota bacterium]